MGIILKVGNTGGPCSGKSSSRAIYSEYLAKAGFTPIFLEEEATKIIMSGILPDGNVISLEEFQSLLTKAQLCKEENYINHLKHSKQDIVLIMDRTIADARAYVSKEMWDNILMRVGLTQAEVFERYDLIIHLVSAADGAEEFYTTANNQARTEGIEEAKKLDLKTKEAYYGHKEIHYITNETSFEEKLQKAVNCILSALGKATPIFGKQKKYITRKISHEMLERSSEENGFNAQKMLLVQTYLMPTPMIYERRVRSVEFNGSISYYYTEKRKDKTIIKDKAIDYATYNSYLQEKIPNSNTITKQRWVFSFNNLYFQYDEFEEWQKYGILEIQVTNLQEQVLIPECFDVTSEITGDERFQNRNMSIKFIMDV